MINRFQLHDGQRQVAECLTRFVIVVAGRRWRKTSVGVVLSLVASTQRKRVLWCAPVYAQANIAWKAFRALCRQIGGFQIQEAQRTIRHRSGGEFRCASSERPENIRGVGIDYCVMDEADFQVESVWAEVIRPALADRKGRALFLTTPHLENGWVHRLYELGLAGTDPSWASFHFPSWTNPHLDPEEIEAMRSSMTSIEFAREVEARFVSAQGARIRREWLRYERCPEERSVAMGVDLAISERASADWTACVVLGRTPRGEIYVLDAQRVRAPFHGVIDFIQTLASKWDPSAIGVEDVAYQRSVIQELLRTTKLPVRGIRPNGDKISRLAPLEARYEQGLVRHTHGLSGWFEDELLSFPIAKYDDGVDALTTAYRAFEFERGPVVQPPMPQASDRWSGYEGRGF